MFSTLPTALADRFALIIGTLLSMIAARGGRDHAAGPLVILVWDRVSRLRQRFSALMAKLEAGTLRAPRKRAAGVRVARAPRVADPAALRIPSTPGWLGQFVPEARSAGSQLSHLLSDPETAALLAQAPQAGRIVRPLCRLLGIVVPEVVALPPCARPSRKKRARAKTPRPAPPMRFVSRLAGPSPGVIPRCRSPGERRRGW